MSFRRRRRALMSRLRVVGDTPTREGEANGSAPSGPRTGTTVRFWPDPTIFKEGIEFRTPDSRRAVPDDGVPQRWARVPCASTSAIPNFEEVVLRYDGGIKSTSSAT